MIHSAIYEEPMPGIVRLLGGKWRDGKRAWRMKWGELSISRGIAAELCLFEDGYSLNLHAFRINVFIKLPFLRRFYRHPKEMMESWGFSVNGDTAHFNWGDRTKVLALPWRNWIQVANEVRRPDGSWVPYVGEWEINSAGMLSETNKEPDGREIVEAPYRYLLRSGKVQEVTASVYVERRIRKLKMLKRLPFAKTTYAIDVRFSDEVGEESGSWKGGCIGCGYTIKPGESPLQCLKRMEQERRF